MKIQSSTRALAKPVAPTNKSFVQKENFIMDLICLGIAAVFFAVSFILIAGCDRLSGG
jgi:hypothetical protein